MPKLFELRRPAYKSKSGIVNRPIIPFKKSQFVVDDDTIRPRTARASGTKPRVPLGVSAMRSMDEQAFGTKVQLSEKTLNKLFNVKVDDPTDLAYLAKKTRLETEGKSPVEILALLGKQRQITKRVNLADASLAVEDKLELLERAIQSGSDKTANGLSAILGQTSLLVGDGSFLDKMSSEELVRLRDVLRDIDMPKSYRKAGFTHRIYNLPQYREESGLVNIFLMSHLSGRRTLSAPLDSVSGRENPPLTGYIQYMTRDSAQARREKQERYIDLEERRFLTRIEAMSLANQGVDNGSLGGEPMPDGGWNPKIDPTWALSRREYSERGAVAMGESEGESKSEAVSGAVSGNGVYSALNSPLPFHIKAAIQAAEYAKKNGAVSGNGMLVSKLAKKIKTSSLVDDAVRRTTPSNELSWDEIIEQQNRRNAFDARQKKVPLPGRKATASLPGTVSGDGYKRGLRGRGTRRRSRQSGNGAGASTRMTMGTDDEGKGNDDDFVPNEYLPVGVTVTDTADNSNVPYAEAVEPFDDSSGFEYVVPTKKQKLIRKLKEKIREMEEIIRRVRSGLVINDERLRFGLITPMEHTLVKNRYNRRIESVEANHRGAMGQLMSLELDPSF